MADSKVGERRMKAIEKVLYGMLVVFVIYIIIEIIRKIFGGSLGFEEIVISLLVANLGYSFYLSHSINKVDSKISGHIGWHKGKASH